MCGVLLSTAYLGNIEYFAALAGSRETTIEVQDNYIRQTYRNRASILTANGVMDLTVPVIKPKEKTPCRDIRISEDGKWRKLHLNAIASAYGNSPFWEYYQDDLIPIYEKRQEFLLDLNMELTETICGLLNIDCTITESKSYINDVESANSVTDLRWLSEPSNKGRTIKEIQYWQVFRNRFGFVPNLSVIDLLMNLGPEALVILTESYEK